MVTAAEKALSEVRYARRQLELARSDAFNNYARSQDCTQRAIEALQRAETILEDPGNAAASDALLDMTSTCPKCNTSVSDSGFDASGAFHPGMACRLVNAARQGRPYRTKGGA